MPDENLPDTGASEPPATGAPPAGVDEVFPLVSDLGQTLLDWSWEGTVGLEDKIDG
jgi:hypothetical protein